MKTKIIPLFFLVLIVVSAAQPIFASSPHPGDTKITGKNGQPLQDITVNTGSSIELQAKLYCYYYIYDEMGCTTDWFKEICRYLDFYVYKANADGTNGDLVWSDTAITNFFTANANPDEFSLTEKGTYNLVVKYGGNLKHRSGTAKFHVV